jgi:hypothetical protein
MCLFTWLKIMPDLFGFNILRIYLHHEHDINTKLYTPTDLSERIAMY